MSEPILPQGAGYGVGALLLPLFNSSLRLNVCYMYSCRCVYLYLIVHAVH